jgi:hypothetical protein
MTELDRFEDEQLVTSRKKSPEMSNPESAGLSELNHATSIDQFAMFHGTLAAEQADPRAQFVKAPDRRVRGRQHHLTTRF